MPFDDDGSVDQSEVEALFDKDGDFRGTEQDEEDSPEDGQGEQDQQEEGDETQGQEDEEKEEEEESEESEEDEDDEEEPESNLDWSKVDQRYRQAYEKEAGEVKKLRKDYGKLHSQFAKLNKSRETEESTVAELRQDADIAQKWNAILEQHPHIQDILKKELAKLNDPLQAEDVPDYLKDDPVFQHVQQKYEPYIRQLEARLRQFEGKTKVVDQWQENQSKAENKQRLDGLLNQARTKFKGMFGKDMTEDEESDVLQYMLDNKYYRNGAVAVAEVFQEQYEKALKGRQAQDLKAKAKKFGSRPKSVNPNRATSTKHAATPEEAIQMALAEQGYGT